ncbi:MAG: branched-chain amino acid ABC transporter permease [Deltaproteobacteria bacterium]|uniref:Branched-chain amino acid ABC transporter permease n=1 Tax=Candidatus Zymogenus saltonus TaxID=2844893 RepID=A0A9D8KG29_9DELT|nr:branched-chain amino acid ABC transporter permease [Candidatus Zymogenus saltonus]
MLKRIPRYSPFKDKEKFSAIFSENVKYFYVVLFVLAFFIPVFIPNKYVIHTFISVMLYMVLALGLNIIPGFTGLLDLGYVGFYAIGAYTAATMTYHLGTLGPPWGFLSSFWFILPIAALNGALWGILLGVPTLRLTGDYFAIVTFGFASLVELIIINEMWLTRGPMGIIMDHKPVMNLAFMYPLTKHFFAEPIRFTLVGDAPFFYILLSIVIITIIIMNRLEDSRLGRAWFAIREDEIAAECSGINIMKYKVIAFAISASFGGLAGSVFAFWFMFTSPESFKFWESILILCMVVLGGMGSIPGVILGALVLTSLTEVVRELLDPWPDLVQARFLVFGVILIVMMRFKPAGLIPLSRVKREMGSRDKSIIDAMNESFYKFKSGKG